MNYDILKINAGLVDANIDKVISRSCTPNAYIPSSINYAIITDFYMQEGIVWSGDHFVITYSTSYSTIMTR